MSIAVLSVALQTRQVAAAEGHFVVDGVAKDVRVVGRKWKTENGALVCAGTGNVMHGGKQIGPGDFAVNARLTIQ